MFTLEVFVTILRKFVAEKSGVTPGDSIVPWYKTITSTFESIKSEVG